MSTPVRSHSSKANSGGDVVVAGNLLVFDCTASKTSSVTSSVTPNTYCTCANLCSGVRYRKYCSSISASTSRLSRYLLRFSTLSTPKGGSDPAASSIRSGRRSTTLLNSSAAWDTPLSERVIIEGLFTPTFSIGMNSRTRPIIRRSGLLSIMSSLKSSTRDWKSRCSCGPPS